ncbi:MAG: hypothetical protein MUP85_23180 [Candidatus Lokiarchaeota archaeon]|nr:hypothetical protein [Candidatus Lokiarchaeota archaeon]
MNIRKYIDLRLIGLVGSCLLIISQFSSWYSGLTLINIYLITTSVAIEDSFLYLFPLISGSICFIGTFLVLYKLEYKLNSVIINFIGLGFFLIFIFEIVPKDFPYLVSAEIGFYFAVIGALLILLDILNVLKLNNNLEEGS